MELGRTAGELSTAQTEGFTGYGDEREGMLKQLVSYLLRHSSERNWCVGVSCTLQLPDLPSAPSLLLFVGVWAAWVGIYPVGPWPAPHHPFPSQLPPQLCRSMQNADRQKETDRQDRPDQPEY